MCFAYAEFSHKGRGRGKWYELSISSALELDETKGVSSIAKDGELGRGGIFGAKLDDDWLP